MGNLGASGGLYVSLAGDRVFALPGTITGSIGVISQFPEATELLDKVGLSDRAHHLPAELSGGEQQRVALARALMCEPEVIFADEPTGNLDAMTGAEILKLLFGFGGKPFALVMVTHSAEAAAQCDRTLHLEGGRFA